MLAFDKANRWSVFHNSFRLFVLEKTTLRLGQKDPSILLDHYAGLANIAHDASPDDPQRWFELRYLYRAQRYKDVVELASSERFRLQFIEKRPPVLIHDDLNFAFLSLLKVDDQTKLVDLILSRHELNRREGALFQHELVDAYIELGDLDAASGLVQGQDRQFRNEEIKAFDVVDALIANGETIAARNLFEANEPVAKILGTEPIDTFQQDQEMLSWARRALIFRSPARFS